MGPYTPAVLGPRRLSPYCTGLLWAWFAGCIAGCVLASACAPLEVEEPREQESALVAARSSRSVTRAIEPLPERVDVDPARVALGERLFQDSRLSGDGSVACVDCHSLAHGGADGRVSSEAPGRPRGKVNVPSVFNVAFDFRYAWNGRFATIEQQLDFAMGSPAAMASSWERALAQLVRDGDLSAGFRAAYPGGLSVDSLRDALVAYCRSLVTPNARFDRFLRGELSLSAEEQRGYDTFRDYGCISCHQGVNVGGNMFQRFGVMRDYFRARGGVSQADFGRFAETGQEADRFVFRVPSLRNVALTAPYFHDGSVWTLEEAVTTMARVQLGRDLPGDKAAEIVAFLRSLTGELRGRPL
ncbi:MAG: cytochrome c peroxidase [Myxococcales bacterium]